VSDDPRGEPVLDAPPGGPAVRGALHAARGPERGALVLAHGAGSSCEAPLLVAVAGALAAAGVTVLRCDLPFRQAAPGGPPRAGAPERDRAGLRQAAAFLRARGASRVFLGGHSYGGRQASLLAAEEPGLAAALCLLAYPLHPPGRPAAPRTEHFPRLRTPALFVHGTRDPFGSPAELRAALARIPARTALLLVAGAGHALAPGARTGAGGEPLERVAAAAFLRLLEEPA
jgi:predicted alpha/beta-hydrolase family hydrolase